MCVCVCVCVCVFVCVCVRDFKLKNYTPILRSVIIVTVIS